MPPFRDRKQEEEVDRWARAVVNTWGIIGGDAVPPGADAEFRALFGQACRYRTAKNIADNHRANDRLSEQEEAEETAARKAFITAHRLFYKKYFQP